MTQTLNKYAKTLAENLWWSWQPEGEALWTALGGDLWPQSGQNPKRLLKQLSQNANYTEVLESAKETLTALYTRFEASQNAQSTWHTQVGSPCKGSIAYFSAEYGLHESVAIYSGGLGVLAGDHVKSASDLNLPFTAVGLLYRQGYVQQRVDHEGQQHAHFLTYDFADYPLTALQKDGQEIKVSVPMLGRTCWCKVWSLPVGRVQVLLLDTDLEENDDDLRGITSRLYGGDGYTRIQQELILGVGGVRALQAAEIQADIFHLNEGHSSFLNVERLHQRLQSGQDFDSALEMVRRSSVFTTHTPVEAGHDRFDADLAWRALSWFGEANGMSRDDVVAMGQWPDEQDRNALFNMTFLALKTAQFLNGVADLHGQVSRKMFGRYWGNPPVDEVPIGHVTNGVHAPTWQAHEVRALLTEVMGEAGAETLSDQTEQWAKVDQISDESLWATRGVLRQRLIDLGRKREAKRRERLGLDPWQDRLDPNALTIGFARRFATYKRANLIFSEMERLLAILEKAPGPVQLFFAGKAHPADEGGQALVKAVYQASQHPALQGRVLLIEDYDMEVGRIMVQGADVWLNNPRRPKEASGTSGMKVSMNGGLNLSILDGWWPEGFNGTNGWAIGEPKLYTNPETQDYEDAQSLYACLESEVIPCFFDRNAQGLPQKWLSMSKSAIASCTPTFHSQRQVIDYVNTLYVPALKASL